MADYVMAIDPGNEDSAYCLIDKESLKPIEHGKVPNNELLARLRIVDYGEAVIERVASYGMAVGRTVFETCEWIGRFTQIINDVSKDVPINYVYRQDEKLHICHDSRAKDANIRRALIDRFATHDLKNGRGTKKDPDWFYGFHADVWAAYAVGITCIEREGGET